MSMSGRDRILAALDGDAPDRLPLALAFYRVDGPSLAPAGEWRDELVDVEFAGLVLVIETLVLPLVNGAVNDAVLGEETAPQVVAVAADQGVVEIE